MQDLSLALDYTSPKQECVLFRSAKGEHAFHCSLKSIYNLNLVYNSQVKFRNRIRIFPALFYLPFASVYPFFVLMDTDCNNNLILNCSSFFLSIPNRQLLPSRNYDISLFLKALEQKKKIIGKCCLK